MDPEEVEVVPSKWVSEDQQWCYWPPWHNTTKEKSAIKKQMTPAPDWVQYAVRVKGRYGKLLAGIFLLEVIFSKSYTGWTIYLKTLKYLENYASDKKKWVMKVVRLEGGHPMIPNSTPHRHPLGVGVGGR